ncbi:gmppb [Symbiodinium sp. KB8]|nr:gmppb [Symbiodinium sp. KB8]
MGLKALILVGGYGTRLRPLTFTKLKPLVEFCNLPILFHQLEALSKVGVTEVVLAVSYRPDSIIELIPEIKKLVSAKYGIEIIVSQEEEPLGTGGPLALAKKTLGGKDPFFVFNADVTCEYPLEELLKFHRAHGKEGTLTVTTVTDPSKYGVIVHDADGKIQRFVEKPKEYVGNHINAGMYIFNPEILDRIELKPTSIERDVFPVMADENQLYCMELPGYWMDIGQPKDYLTGMCLHLASLKTRKPAALKTGENLVGNVMVDETAEIDATAVVGPDVVVGPGVKIGPGARVKRATLFSGVKIGAHSYVHSAIIGWNSSVGKWVSDEWKRLCLSFPLP